MMRTPRWRGCSSACISLPRTCVDCPPGAAANREAGGAFAEALRAAFTARSCVIVAGGRVLGASAAAAPDCSPSTPQGAVACVLSAAADGPGEQSTITLALPCPASTGEAELLHPAAAVAKGWTGGPALQDKHASSAAG